MLIRFLYETMKYSLNFLKIVEIRDLNVYFHFEEWTRNQTTLFLIFSISCKCRMWSYLCLSTMIFTLSVDVTKGKSLDHLAKFKFFLIYKEPDLIPKHLSKYQKSPFQTNSLRMHLSVCSLLYAEIYNDIRLTPFLIIENYSFCKTLKACF